MSGVRARRTARRLTSDELAAIDLPPSRRHNGGPPLDDPPPATLYRPSAPAIIVKRKVLYYRGLWAGSEATAQGRLLVEGRAGALSWVDIRDLFDGEWDGQAATALLRVNQLVGFGAGGEEPVIPGSQTWTSNGTHVVPLYNRLEVIVVGGGGPGGSTTGTSGGRPNGNLSRYNSSSPVTGNGGEAGAHSLTGSGSGGSGGTGSRGDTNSTGNNGSNGTVGSGYTNAGRGGNGGSRPAVTGTLVSTASGTAGGGRPISGGNGQDGINGGAPGGGGGGAGHDSFNNYGFRGAGGGGGAGGAARKMWNKGDSGAPSPGDSIGTTVGAQRQPLNADYEGGDGARGEIRAGWD